MDNPTKIPKPRKGGKLRKRKSPAGAKPTRIPKPPAVLLRKAKPPAVLSRKPKPPPVLSRKRPAVPPRRKVVIANPEAARKKRLGRLGMVLKRVIVEERTGTLKGRIRYAKMVRKAIEGVQPCLQQLKGKGNEIGFVDASGAAVVRLGKDIGSGAYGDAFVNTGAKGIARVFKFSSKLTPIISNDAIREGRLLRKMSKLAERGICQNMPITYKVMECNKMAQGIRNAPPMTKQNKYVVILNELADGDLFDLFKNKLTQQQYESIMMQTALALHAFHGLGYAHNDTHLGNFLYHRVKPGGYWRYNVRVAGESVPIFVPNRGHLVVLWDPGMATDVKLNDIEHYEGVADIWRPIVQMNSLGLEDWAEKRLKPIPEPIKKAMKMKTLFDTMQAFVSNEKTGKSVVLADRVFHMMVRGIRDGLWLPSIRIGQRLRLPVRRISMGRGSAGKVRTPGGRTAMKTRTIAPRSLSRIINPARAFKRTQVSSVPYRQ